jgi:hypothetical protein
MKKIYRPKSMHRGYGISASLAAVLLLTACASNPPPTSQIAVSKAAITSASAAGANEFAPLALRSAQDKMEGAEKAMVTENYVLARELSEEAEVDAQLSSVTARSVKAQKAVTQLQQDNAVLRQELDRKTQ